MTQIIQFSEYNSSTRPLVTLLGPTATGKTALGVYLAKIFNGEIISADSRQVYQGMDIGTGKDLEEYEDIPYHLIDIVSPGYEYNLFEFVKDFSEAFEDISTRNKVPFLVGGTGLYLDAILNRYELTRAASNDLSSHSTEALRAMLLKLKPKQHNDTDLADRNRLISAIQIALSEQDKGATITPPDYKPLTLGLQFPREVTRERITQRLKARLKTGMVEEVSALHDSGVNWEQLDFYGLEYRFIARYLQDQISYNDMYQKLNSAIHQFAKQQEKWFRNIAKKGHHIEWLDMSEDIKEQATQILEGFL